ncbi:hypothetical protein AMTRI_Chr13g83420 [Amborella trichopoda]|uniref:Alpha/beta-Hydrolases superfamily protein n=1 Tax=Amborella trichopoda TaxID=13333 RepID=W1NSS0_AMBTC|nr:uncharacterized protein LOC18428195 [Amborella trichopoda]XP_011621164.1 uncharacterized protein LOC18428195 [Amborella trichopoda]XP_011621165.1 uncharacterized protein LOC18428195 [Amborella trichopoda]XP_020519323.1 uncharacterized protein LOC18428195 [Amborella trichopoda]XP_020519324.1 uncharacterized protein LOC18428195 [Amborella trichopoda]ERN00152.1 hypothetical protein AMTR_s00111p00034520 [Amborella trichopoda]|eukprot:XP_006837298.1 uncharacterized protein LOC18428195 [Amborella trichopoda]
MDNLPSSKEEGTSSSLIYNNDLMSEGVIPQLFSCFPLPAINEASSYLLQTTSNLGRRFSTIVEEVVLADGSKTTQIISSSDQQARPLLGNSISSSEQCSTSSEPSFATADPSMHDRRGKSRKNNESGERNAAIAESTQNFWNGASIFKGLVSRVQKTLRGSADDIGWLQREPGMPPVEDGTRRFNELLVDIRKGEHKLPESLVYLLVPGLFSNHGPLYFVNTKRFFSKLGLACHIAKIHSEASVEKNAREIKDYIEELYWGSGKRVLLLGHSKGGVDAAACLSLYWSELKDKVAGLAFAQSPYGGSPIASDILREGQLGDVETRKLMELLICKIIKGDLQALEDLTYDKRKEFIRHHKLPPDVPVVSFHTEASMAPGVFATLSRVAHAELPRLPIPTFGPSGKEEEVEPTKLPVVFPLAAAMAACALHLYLRYGEKSDGLVMRKDAEVPGSVVIRPDRQMDHGWMVYSSLSDDPNEADASQVCEALLTLLVELAEKKKLESAKKNE